MKPLIAISGMNGQLGWELRQLASAFPEYRFVFCDRDVLDISSEAQVRQFFDTHRPAVFINCAAYTGVDKAETDQEQAYAVNAAAMGYLARACGQYNSLLIGFSTDYVFDGNGSVPYPEDAATRPVNYYGYTKEVGEKLALANWHRCIIIRTSWVYSSHGHNFVKTMLRLMRERNEVKVVNDQFGSPTYARDLAGAVMKICAAQLQGASTGFGIYHYSNEGVISWYDFALEIRRLAGLDCKVHPVDTSGFPTAAKRPRYSVLGKKRLAADYQISFRDWKDSLAECMAGMASKG